MSWPTPNKLLRNLMRQANSSSRTSQNSIHYWARKLENKFMDNSYEEFKAITDKYYTDWQMPKINVFVELLRQHGIELRNRDGQLHEATFSVPKSVGDALVLGMRYKKKDGTFSEDLFLFQKGKPIQKGYKGELEKIVPEYTGTHKGSPNTSYV